MRNAITPSVGRIDVTRRVESPNQRLNNTENANLQFFDSCKEDVWCKHKEILEITKKI
jgi:hypothetical protein